MNAGWRGGATHDHRCHLLRRSRRRYRRRYEYGHRRLLDRFQVDMIVRHRGVEAGPVPASRAEAASTGLAATPAIKSVQGEIGLEVAAEETGVAMGK